MQGGAVELVAPRVVVKLDIGCGPKKKEGHVGLDIIAFPGVDHVIHIGCDRWPFDDGSVDEAYSSHFVEHLTAQERIHFCNELYRVLVPRGRCEVIVPHWASCRAYGDPTHQWAPVSEFWFYYLSKEWRAANAPHTDEETVSKHRLGPSCPGSMEESIMWSMRNEGRPRGFSCDFEVTWGYAINPNLMSRNQEFQQFALNYYRESVTDIHAALIKR